MVVLSSFPQPTEGIRLEQRNTAAYLNNSNLGKGTLYIAESRLSWIGSAGNGFSIEYPNISLHAISRDLNAFPEECLFLMLNVAIEDQQQDLNPDDSDSEITTELRFVPEDRGMLDAMFHAMSACQALHPDPEDSFSDEDFYEDADENIPVDETNSQMANLCIERNNAFGAENMVVVGSEGARAADMALGRASDRETSSVADRAVDRAVGRTPEGAAEEVAYSQPSSEHRTSYSFHTDHTWSESRWFDDADN